MACSDDTCAWRCISSVWTLIRQCPTGCVCLPPPGVGDPCVSIEDEVSSCQGPGPVGPCPCCPWDSGTGTGTGPAGICSCMGSVPNRWCFTLPAGTIYDPAGGVGKPGLCRPSTPDCDSCADKNGPWELVYNPTMSASCPAGGAVWTAQKTCTVWSTFLGQCVFTQMIVEARLVGCCPAFGAGLNGWLLHIFSHCPGVVGGSFGILGGVIPLDEFDCDGPNTFKMFGNICLDDLGAGAPICGHCCSLFGPTDVTISIC